MKKVLTLLMLCAAIFTNGVMMAHGDWKELNAFHGVMSKTFHPSEEGNLQPLKMHAGDLVTRAKAWQAAAVPHDYNPTETKKVLTALVAKCEEIEKAVKDGKSDAELKKMIHDAHEVFHQIAEKCRIPENH